MKAEQIDVTTAINFVATRPNGKVVDVDELRRYRLGVVVDATIAVIGLTFEFVWPFTGVHSIRT